MYNISYLSQARSDENKKYVIDEQCAQEDGDDLETRQTQGLEHVDAEENA